MKAIVCRHYGSPDVLELAELDKPTPKDNEVLIRIHATTVTAGDCEVRRFKFPWFIWIPLRLYMGLFKPRVKILGQELSGQVEAVGSAVTAFKQGDAVLATTGFHFGTYAEYISLPIKADGSMIALKPAGMTDEESAPLLLWGMIALDFLKRSNIQQGQHIVINGAGGSIGTYAVQIAKLLGAEVTAVDSASKLAMLRTIGADHVLDYAQQDFTKQGLTYDVIFDVVGNSSFTACIKALKPEGRYLFANPSFTHLLRGWWTSKTSTKQILHATESGIAENLVILNQYITSGKLKTIIDKQYPLTEIADAHRYVETGAKQGNVIIKVYQPA